ncbi:MAG: carbon monoxide dehydrogenase subunit G [Chloroflexi bacterium]|nr:carbon monoxide dehydrogenase subunit G [Chloroflexota bacterium]
MEFTGSVDIPATRERVFAFVTNPDKVGQCGPAVETIEILDPTHFRAKARVGVGFISARFVVDLEITEQQPPDMAIIKARGQAPGSAVDAVGRMNLVDGPEPGTTTMLWAAEVNISGMLASVGARMVEGTADKMIGQTFDCIRAKIVAEG